MQQQQQLIRTLIDGSFAVSGDVDGRRVEAVLRDGVLRADVELLRRADIVVALEETFELDGKVRHQASIGTHWAATLLTFMRAMDRVTDVAFDVSLLTKSNGHDSRQSTRAERDDFRHAVKQARRDSTNVS
jgi:SpoVK/Ycf46/Vps4 family AAA+-type ATPase